MKCRNLFHSLCLSSLLMAPSVLLAQNQNCTIIVPDAPLTAAGLATPYQLTATDPTQGKCDEANVNSSAFVQAAIIDPATGQISIYNPLIIDAGSSPAIKPVLPVLPANAIVALWFGFNGENLVQQGASSGALESAHCVNGLPNSVFGQVSYCNAPAFFKAANHAVHSGQLQVPERGLASDGSQCPTVRHFYVVDQDQSDNLPVTYLVTASGLIAQNTKANASALVGATTLGNPSDNGLLDRFLDPAMNCTPWKVADLADPGQTVPGLALNELQARAHQRRHMALVPAGDPMVLNTDGSINIDKVNAYRRGMDQHEIGRIEEADTARYCRAMLWTAPPRLAQNQANLTASPSPVSSAANSLFTFMAQRFVASFNILDCGGLLGVADPISFTADANGVAVSATIDLNLLEKEQKQLQHFQANDEAAEAADQAAESME
ncbi:MAG TPA: hypothetical protein VMX38_10840 [Verrucomicrobiae bacterium]|jgi:hypothetical protein|nr:hypothetical protein [Verrucomicrobiae bacterium]